MTLNQNLRSTKRFAVIGYTGSKRRFKKIKNDLLFSNAEWNYNREREKSKYLNNIWVLPTSVFIFDKFVDGAQPEVAGDIGGRRLIFRTLLEWGRSWVRDWSDHINCTIGIGCFSTKHGELRSKSKDWLARNQNNVSEWVDMSTCCYCDLATIKSIGVVLCCLSGMLFNSTL